MKLKMNTLELELHDLRKELPEKCYDVPIIGEPSVDEPFAIPPTQRIEIDDLTMEQVMAARVALKRKKGIKMKKVVQQIGNKYFNYTEKEHELMILNGAEPLRCAWTRYNSIAVFNMSTIARNEINAKIDEMVTNSDLVGIVKKVKENGTVFFKWNNKTQFFDEEGKTLEPMLTQKVMNARMAIRFAGIVKTGNDIWPILRLFQLKLVKVNRMPCIL